jgi:SagB-type dehydrogenase family enzyme
VAPRRPSLDSRRGSRPRLGYDFEVRLGKGLSLNRDRRAFFRLLGGTLAVLSGGTSSASAREGTLEIHRATRNTLLGAVGARLPRLGDPPPSFKPYPGFGRLALPAFSSKPALSLSEAIATATGLESFEAKSIPLRRLSRVLHFTNGVTSRRENASSGPQLRAAPSAGALYAGEIYVVAERVRGLVPGVYYYAVGEHALVALRTGSRLREVTAAVTRPGAIEGAAAAILLTNVFERYSWRYANRGYRYALIDSGHIGENLRLAATSAGLGWTRELRFEDDALNALLDVDGRREAVCAVHAIGPVTGAEAPASGAARALIEKAAIAPEKLPREGPLPVRFHEATKLVSAPFREERGVSSISQRPAMGPEVALSKLSPRPEASVERAIQERRSATFFRERPVRLEELAFVMEMAQAPGAFERSIGVDLFFAPHRIEGITPGFYQYRPRERGISQIRRRDLREPMIRACLRQEKAGRAAVAFFMVGRIADAGAAWGKRSYRQLLIESGEIGQRIYLAAEAVGLAARNLSAFYDDELNELLGFDGEREAVLHLTVFGSGD